MHAVGSVTPRGRLSRIAACAISWLAAGALQAAPPAPAASPAPAAPAAPESAFDRIRGGQIKFGYRAEARPFSFKDETGNAAGYSVALCTRIADAMKADLGITNLAVQWVPVTLEGRFRSLQSGQVDMLCEADTVTLARRQDVSFSIATYPGGIGAIVRSDAPARLREVLSGQKLPRGPAWRGNAGQILQSQTFSVVRGTTGEPWLAEKMDEFQLTAQVAPVESYDAGIRLLLDRKVNVLFGDRAILLDAATRNPSAADLAVIDRLFTLEPLALAVPRGDENVRLLVDRALSRLYGSAEMGGLYAKWFGEPGQSALDFFLRSTRPPE